jgi:hypothetical protein
MIWSNTDFGSLKFGAGETTHVAKSLNRLRSCIPILVAAMGTDFPGRQADEVQKFYAPSCRLIYIQRYTKTRLHQLSARVTTRAYHNAGQVI